MKNDLKQVALVLLVLVLLALGISMCDVGWSAESTPQPEATIINTATPSPIPTATATLRPTATSTATASPTITPTARPTATATASPTVTPTMTAGPEASACRPGTIYNVRPGDTLWDIAQCAYGDPHRWPIIYQTNPQLTGGPHLIHANNPLFIPHQR